MNASSIRLLLAFSLIHITAAGSDSGGVDPSLAHSVILVIRHAEKPATGPDLTPEGQQRATASVKYFENYTVHSKPLHLDCLFAAQTSASSARPVETVTPLSKALSLPINDRFPESAFAQLATELESGRYAGKDILICWHHGKIPKLLKALGLPGKKMFAGGKWPDDVFCWVVEIRYDKSGNPQIQIIDENLLPGDSQKQPPPGA